MKKSEFKKLIKPIVQECIKESLLEDGLISGVIAEVVKGMSSQTIVEAKAPEPKVDPVKERMKAEYWEKEKGKDSETAMTEYTEYVVRLIQKYKS